MSNFTASKVAALSEAGKYRDGPDLYLIGKGAKSWVLRYKARGRTGEMELCSADLFSLAVARRKALDLRRALHEGRDPLEERNAARKGKELDTAKTVTFADAARRYIEAHKDGWNNPKHRQKWVNTLTTHANPVFGSLPVGEIDTDLLLRAVEPRWKRAPETVSRLREGREVDIVGSDDAVVADRGGPAKTRP